MFMFEPFNHSEWIKSLVMKLILKGIDYGVGFQLLMRPLQLSDTDQSTRDGMMAYVEEVCGCSI